MKFYNRRKELDFFQKVKGMDKKHFVVVFGRRRIGKTTLIRKAFEDTKVFYYFVEVKKEETLLKDLSFSFSKAVYNSWYDLFSELFNRYEYIVFDEFQNFHKVNPAILYALQHAWDDNKNKTKMIVLGSYVGLMKNIFTDEKMPLFGRADSIINIKEFPLGETVSMLKDFGYDIHEAFQIYAMVGGVPKYLWLFKDKRDIKQLIYEIFIDEFAPLREEARNLLISEFGSEHKTYFSILGAIAGGMKSLSEISDSSGIEATKLSKYLTELSEIYEILSKERPLLSEKKRNYKYRIKDHYYNFFFRNIYRNYSIMEYAPEKALEIVWSNFNQYMGFQFEEICRQFLLENPGFFGFIPKDIGKHWGRVPYRKNESYDIDLVAYDEENVLFGECKWSNKKVGEEEYRKLLLRSEYVNTGKRRKIYALFSRSGFEENLLKLKSKNLFLITPEDMMRVYEVVK
jgi:hypothetical protein